MKLLLCLSLVILSCSSDDRGTDSPSPWDDCALGQILTPDGDPCTYPGRNEVVSVNTEGELCYEDNCRTTDFGRYRKEENGERVLDLGVASLGDGRYAITRIGNDTLTVREILERAGEVAELVVCTVGLKLKPGEGCTFDGGEFEVRDDGFGCIAEGSICAGTGMHINNFSAEKTGDTWTILNLP